MKYAVWGLILLLLVARQDFWLWDNPRLVWGFMPVGLLFQVGISLGAAFLWYLATIYSWPGGLDNIQPEESEETRP